MVSNPLSFVGGETTTTEGVLKGRSSENCAVGVTKSWENSEQFSENNSIVLLWQNDYQSS